MDLKGYQYHGILHPGPTALIVSMHPKIGTQTAKVESITDEFMTIQKANDSIMTRLDAIVEKGDIDTSYRVMEENVNRVSKASSASAAAAAGLEENGEEGKREPQKRGRGSGRGGRGGGRGGSASSGSGVGKKRQRAKTAKAKR